MDPTAAPVPETSTIADRFPDLNAIPFPKLEPKSEPIDDINECPSNPNPVPAIPTEPQLPNLATGDESALLAEYFRLAQLFAAAAANNHRALVPLLPPQPAATAVAPPEGSSSGIVVSKKRKARSGEMVRCSNLDYRDQMYFRDMVRRTRITYESLRALLIREEAAKGDTFGSIWGKRTRPDLKAATLMAGRELWLNRDKRIIGDIPGISIGDVFFFRIELCVLGLHGYLQAGIDYVSGRHSPNGEPIATSIIVSGGYEDDDDKGLMLIYTGQGGREQNMNKHSMNQKLEGGNLALERSMTYGVEIRVIRGLKSSRSPIGKVYVYDGLYRITECWLDVGKSGFSVYKYKLLRIEGQEEMGSDILKFAELLKVDPLKVRPTGYLTLDISKGKENFPVAVFNDIDDDHDPLLFEYLAHPILPQGVSRLKTEADISIGCECTSNCSTGCCCAERNGGEFAYDKSGILTRGKPLIYECGPLCRCPPSCPNRVGQNGLKHRLEIFRSRETGWGVRSLDLIQAGSFICEFSGVILTKKQAEDESMHGESLVHPGQFPGRWLEWGDISDVLSHYLPADFPSVPDINFSIDVSRARNVACYLSHSCNPNVFAQLVLFDHYNVSYPHVMIFALENIPPLRELSIDYGIRDEPVKKLTM